MNEFKVGDEVISTSISTYFGIVTGIQEDGIIVVSDYTNESGGSSQTDEEGIPFTRWNDYYKHIALRQPRPKPEEHKHRMGLDPEEVDWEAHHAFLREYR
jgi:hypothetical protein